MAKKTREAKKPRLVAAVLGALRRRACSIVGETRTLTALRDSLLPRLLSGAITLGGAERAV